MNGKSSPNGDVATDMDLMLYIDDELDAHRRALVEQRLRADASFGGKLQALRATSAFVRAGAETGAFPDIADAVMANIAAGSAGQGEAYSNGLGKLELAHVELKSAPKNGNGKVLLGFASLAVAAAFALFIWGKGGSAPAPVASHAPVAASEAVVGEPSPEPPPPASQEYEDQPAVEVAAVDFGTKKGSIFYVPVDEIASKMTTTVVWFADDGSESEDKK